MEKPEHFRDQLTYWSRCKFLAWWLLTLPSKMPFLRSWAPKRIEVSLTLRNGGKVFFRNRDDYGVAYEVFVDGVYDMPNQEPLLILDLGGHVGFTTLMFAWRFPSAKIIVLEPDSGRAAQIQRHVGVNGLGPRVEVIQAAASVRDGRARLSAAGSGSRLGCQGEEVAVVDIFSLAGNRKVDILKMDIEGSEFEILADERFEVLAPGLIAMEWHNTAECPDGRKRCRDLLTALGYEISRDLNQLSWAGNLVAIRPLSTPSQLKPA